MNDETLARQLHDKATRGIALTETERKHLAAWYERQDREERALLTSSTAETPATIKTLRAEVEAATARLLAVTQRMQTVSAESEALRRDIAAIHRQLAQTGSTQPA